MFCCGIISLNATGKLSYSLFFLFSLKSSTNFKSNISFSKSFFISPKLSLFKKLSKVFIRISLAHLSEAKTKSQFKIDFIIPNFQVILIILNSELKYFSINSEIFIFSSKKLIKISEFSFIKLKSIFFQFIFKVIKYTDFILTELNIFSNNL